MIAVIVPVRNAEATIENQLRALAEQGYRGDWVVVLSDNGSTDRSVEVARRWMGRLALRVVDAGSEPGINRARNAGVRAAHDAGADVVVFCDADDEVDPTWLAAMARAATRWQAWGGVIDRTRLSDPARLRPAERRSVSLMQWPGYLPFASGANFGVHVDTWAAVGGFDDTFVGGGDDVDFSWRLQRAGVELGFADDAVVHYCERSRARDLARQFRSYGRQDAHLYRVHRSAGMPGRGVWAGVRSWIHLVVKGPAYARTAAERGQWVRSAARRWGRLEGSLTYRTLYL